VPIDRYNYWRPRTSAQLLKSSLGDFNGCRVARWNNLGLELHDVVAILACAA
jgi:hypothetical protein